MKIPVVFVVKNVIRTKNNKLLTGDVCILTSPFLNGD